MKIEVWHKKDLKMMKINITNRNYFFNDNIPADYSAAHGRFVQSKHYYFC